MLKLRAGNLIASALVVLSLTLLCGLGAWQWQRGMHKTTIANRIAAEDIITLKTAPPQWSPLEYRRVRLQGGWRPRKTFLLANRTHRGRLGYEIFTPYQLTDGATLLINRGWQDAKQINRGGTTTLPQDDSYAPVGTLYQPQPGFTLGEAYRGGGWPLEIQYMDINQLQIAYGAKLQPVAVALAATHPAAFAPRWRAVVVPPTRHFAYAVQWWGLAVTLLIFSIIWRRRSRRS